MLFFFPSPAYPLPTLTVRGLYKKKDMPRFRRCALCGRSEWHFVKRANLSALSVLAYASVVSYLSFTKSSAWLKAAREDEADARRWVPAAVCILGFMTALMAVMHGWRILWRFAYYQEVRKCPTCRAYVRRYGPFPVYDVTHTHTHTPPSRGGKPPRRSDSGANANKKIQLRVFNLTTLLSGTLPIIICSARVPSTLIFHIRTRASPYRSAKKCLTTSDRGVALYQLM